MLEMDKRLHDLCAELSLSVRFNTHNGSISLYHHLGEFECNEQAILFLEKHFPEDIEDGK
jgi:hypothetical protein